MVRLSAVLTSKRSQVSQHVLVRPAIRRCDQECGRDCRAARRLAVAPPAGRASSVTAPPCASLRTLTNHFARGLGLAHAFEAGLPHLPGRGPLRDRRRPPDPRASNGSGSPGGEALAQGVGVIGAVGEHDLTRSHGAEELQCGRRVMGLALGELQRDRQAVGVDHGGGS